MNTINQAVYGYIRVSTKDQKQSGGGFSDMGQDTNEEIPF